MKKPTAMELWNFRIIIVPPILNANNINADQIDMKPSDRALVPITANDINVNIPVIERIEYLRCSFVVFVVQSANKVHV